MYGKDGIIITEFPLSVSGEFFLLIALCISLILLIVLMIYKFFQSLNKDDDDLNNYPKKLKPKDNDAP